MEVVSAKQLIKKAAENAERIEKEKEQKTEPNIQNFGFSPNGSSFGAANPNNNFIMPFLNIPLVFNDQYVENGNGGIIHQTSSNEQVGKQLSLDELASRIISNETLKKYTSSLTKDDIYLSNDGGRMLMMKYHRPNFGDEIFRLDLCGNDILIQAPFENPCILRGTEFFKYAAIPVNSELGEKILSNFGYRIKDSDVVDFEKSILRKEEDSI